MKSFSVFKRQIQKQNNIIDLGRSVEDNQTIWPVMRLYVTPLQKKQSVMDIMKTELAMAYRLEVHTVS